MLTYRESELIIFAEKAGYRVAGVWKETASGSRNNREQWQKILALTQAREIDVILVTELTRWGRSTLDLFHILNDLQALGICLITQTEL